MRHAFCKRHDSIPTRQSLLRRLRNWEDHASWEDFFNTYWRLIFGVARQSGLTEAEAQEVLQETVISVAKKMRENKEEPSFGSFKCWLLRVTRCRIVDQFRKRPRLAHPWSHRGAATDTTRTATAERVPDESVRWDEVWEEQWQRNLLDVAMERVKADANPRHWLLFQQHALKQLPPQQVATKHGVSLASVYMAKYRISNAIKREVKKLEKEMR